ncbi:MAG: DNA (cytosine-5-)-methyltransferase [Candidatus Ratteibacteria bacterium]|jgi:DNA (cytosine-5)-methyltransferase 1
MTKNQCIVIPNHYTARLSSIDMEMAVCVPPGGNWKNIPDSIPSKRLESIRISYAAGGGSRSTYYGRLHPDKPSYTINTYFNRPGNGCHFHYDYEGGQHRVLSEREAARLQSFPDNFVFSGSHVSIHKQIGNAVPPLLAYQVACALPCVGQYVDLFSGAGGLSLGFKWAGWQPLVANDIEESFLATYRQNIHSVAICGDIRKKEVVNAILLTAKQNRCAEKPFFVLGGPPCQGFSTAGKRRTLEDERNHLFNEFKHLLQKLKPNGFIFENVMGLLNMEKGRFFEMVHKELDIPGNRLSSWIIQTEQYGIPQRRTRLILISVPNNWPKLEPPKKKTSFNLDQPLFDKQSPVVSVSDALSDLPILQPGEDGSGKDYASPPLNAYQRFMRGVISPTEYLCGLHVTKEVCNDTCNKSGAFSGRPELSCHSQAKHWAKF